MRKRRSYFWLTAAVGGGLILGCRSASNRPPYPDQPLLLGKTPVEGKLETVETDQLAQTEPVAPPLPADALASVAKPLPQVPTNLAAEPNAPPPAEPHNAEPPLAAKPKPFRTAVGTKTPVRAVPAVRTNPSPLNGPAISGPRRAPGDFGHDANYTWLQGVVDKHYRGHVCLRYCDPTVEDRWGGKVRLEDDPRLATLRAGDVVVVEGALLPPTESHRQELWQHYPRYRVSAVMVIEHKE